MHESNQRDLEELRAAAANDDTAGTTRAFKRGNVKEMQVRRSRRPTPCSGDDQRSAVEHKVDPYRAR